MTEDYPHLAEPSEHTFGGGWTTTKLRCVHEYLDAYVTVMARQRHWCRLYYIDAFAGTGYIYHDTGSSDSENTLFAALGGDEPRGFVAGSARIALDVKPPFDGYVFVERSPMRARDLDLLKSEVPALAPRIEVVNDEANAYLRRLCAQPVWSERRAVLFLDPYGMQVEWDTIRAVAGTKAIDLWLLFPLAMSLRLLPRDGVPEAVWADKLDRMFGTHEWCDAFYQPTTENTLFGDQETTRRDCDFDRFAAYFQRRLKSIFPYVAPNPRELRNSKSVPLYLLCFAAANPGKGGAIAVEIAKHILRM